MTLQLHRPDGKGGLEVRTTRDRNWRNDLRSPRWGKALPKGRLPDFENPEMNPTSMLKATVFWLTLAIATFVVLVLGYGTGFWGG